MELMQTMFLTSAYWCLMENGMTSGADTKLHDILWERKLYALVKVFGGLAVHFARRLAAGLR